MEFELFIVDDEPGLSELIADISRDVGIKSFVFDNSLNAWDALKTRKPDAIVLDLGMPNMDGTEFIERMASEGFSDINVVLISGRGQDALAQCREVAQENSIQVLEMLTKPIRLKRMHELFSLLAKSKPSKSKANNILSFDDLSTATRVSQITTRYQPQVSFRDGEITGFDVMMYWNHPEMGLIGRSSFRSLAERDGSITDLTKAMLERVFTEVSQTTGMEEYRFSVDISPLFRAGSLLSELLFLLSDANYVPDKVITLAISERVFLAHFKEVLSVWKEIESSRYRLSIVEVGASAVSESQLQALPFEELKIDKRFVSKALGDKYAMSIVEETIGMAHKAGIVATVDGIKTAELARRMKKAGCDQCSGNYISKPLPYEAIDSWSRNWGHERFGKVV